jgi:hypothetical protein
VPSVVTHGAHRAKRIISNKSFSLKKEKRAVHRANRRLVRQYISVLVKGRTWQADKLERKLDRPRLTAWDVC